MKYIQPVFKPCVLSKETTYHREITPRRYAAARRAVTKQKARYPLFAEDPQVITDLTPEDRLARLERRNARWSQESRDFRAHQIREIRNMLQHMPTVLRHLVVSWWNTCPYPKDP